MATEAPEKTQKIDWPKPTTEHSRLLSAKQVWDTIADAPEGDVEAALISELGITPEHAKRISEVFTIAREHFGHDQARFEAGFMRRLENNSIAHRERGESIETPPLVYFTQGRQESNASHSGPTLDELY